MAGERLSSQERQREDHTEPASIGIRYFELYEDLPAEGKALAYPTRYDRQTKKWKKISVDSDQLRYIYDRWKGSGAKSEAQVQCVYLSGSRRWELVGAPPIAAVQVWTTSGTPQVGDLLAANADGLHPGRLQSWSSSATPTTGPDVWIRFIDYESVDSGAVIGEHGRIFVGQAAGSVTSGGVTKPLYVAEVGEQTFVGKPDADYAKGATATVSLYHRSTEADSTINQTAKALGAAVTNGKWVTVQRVRGGQWYVGCWE